MTKLHFLFLLCIAWCSCNEQPNETKETTYTTAQAVLDVPKNSNAAVACNTIPESFTSYEEAKNFVTSNTFSYSDEVNTSKSSWIRGAAFYSCDRKTGFFVLKTDKQEYIHQHVPVEVWEDFKTAASFGTYYNARIKKKYTLKLKR